MSQLPRHRSMVNPREPHVESVRRRLGQAHVLDVARAAAERAGASLELACERSRERHVCQVREAVWFELYTWTALSWPSIGRIFGNDHTTVLAGARRYAEQHGQLEVSATTGARTVIKRWVQPPHLARVRIVVDLDERGAACA